MAGGITDKTVKGLAPQSWTSVGVWAVLAVIFISAPIQSTRLVVDVVGGTGRWIAYTAFADCGTTPPMEWMTPKECDSAPTEPAATGPAARAAVYGVDLPAPDRAWGQLYHLNAEAVGQVNAAMNTSERGDK